jgi:D-beta-D-heptose 7-phosphate kinase/D-beta-D-heptose 1-phosphate adenosyltransferase
MEQRVRELKTARVLVAGDLILDRYWYGATERVSPEAPVPVVKVDGLEERAGGAANVAANAASLGARVVLAGIAGDDAEAGNLEALCRDASIEVHLLREPGHRTTTKLRVISQHQQLLRLDFESQAEDFDVGRMIDLVSRKIRECNALVLSDYGKGCLSEVQALIRVARGAEKKVIVDPKGPDFERYRGAYLVTPNFAEFEAVAGPCRDLPQLEERARSLCGSYDFDALLVTRGARGMSLIRRNEEAVHLDAEARDVFDVTGAGDTVCAVLGTAIACGQDLPRATALANTAAGLAVAKLGTAVISVDELEAALSGRKESGSRIVSESLLLKEVEAARCRGEKIVMTNGCFDILHAGHVRYLEQAASLGDRLVVAVNSDASVKRIKDPARPLNPLDHRLAVLSGLSSVDWVVAFDDDTPRALIARIRPDVLVKGGDYEPAAIAGAEEVIAAGGEVIVLPHHDELSTSGIIARIRSDGHGGAT